MSTTEAEIKDNLAAWLKEKGQKLVIDRAPIHKIGNDEILIQNFASALNPVDWKIQETGIFVKNYPVILGFDVAGIVRDVGSNVKLFKKGDRVLSYLPNISVRHGPAYGGFQKFSVGTELGTCKIPDWMSFEFASTIPLALSTAAAGLFDYGLGLDKPGMTTTGNNRDKLILVWGGASSVGMFTIQLAKNAGYRVITTCSPENFDHVKELGAEEAFDYHDNNVVDLIKRYIQDKPIFAAYNAVCMDRSTENCLTLLQPNGGRLALTLSCNIPKERIPNNIQICEVFAPNIFLKDEGRVGQWLFHNYLETALEKRQIKPHNVKLFTGGLYAAQKMFDYGRKGHVGNEKCVLYPQETLVVGSGP